MMLLVCCSVRICCWLRNCLIRWFGVKVGVVIVFRCGLVRSVVVISCWILVVRIRVIEL